jgi:hypothetical protein
MTRFSASGPRISYTPIEGPKPFKQIVGLYDMWQALAPETPQAPTADVKTTADAPPAAEPFSATPAAIPIHAAVKAEVVADVAVVLAAH